MFTREVAAELLEVGGEVALLGDAAGLGPVQPKRPGRADTRWFPGPPVCFGSSVLRLFAVSSSAGQGAPVSWPGLWPVPVA